MNSVIVSNKLNGPLSNPPGYSVWVGGQKRGDVENGAVKLMKGQTNVKLDLRPGVLCSGNILCWYYNYGWFSHKSISGPFQDGQTVLVAKVQDDAQIGDDSSDEEPQGRVRNFDINDWKVSDVRLT